MKLDVTACSDASWVGCLLWCCRRMWRSQTDGYRGGCTAMPVLFPKPEHASDKHKAVRCSHPPLPLLWAWFLVKTSDEDPQNQYMHPVTDACMHSFVPTQVLSSPAARC